MRRSRLGSATLILGLMVAAAIAAHPLRSRVWSQDDEPAETAPAALEVARVDRLLLDDVYPIPDERRIVELQFRALTTRGAPVRGLTAKEVEIWQDDERIPIENVQIDALDGTDRGISVALAIDASGTMRGEPFVKAKDGAFAFLDRLRREDPAAIVSFAEDVRVVADFGLQRAETRKALTDFEIDIDRSRKTLLYDGAYRAVDLIRTSSRVPRRAAVVLFSDGKDGGSDKSRERVIAHAQGDGTEPHVLIFSIGYSRFGGDGLAEMRKLAEDTGGDYIQVQSPSQMRDFFDSIATQLVSSYVARFSTDLDGLGHEIRIVVRDKSSERATVYPKVGGPLWPWLAAAGGVALLSIVLFVLMRRRPSGRISIVSGARSGTIYDLKQGRTRIGALEDNDIVIATQAVSRYHAEIVARGRRVRIVDLRSKNGTRVNGQVIQETPLRIGDRIVIADVEMIYER